MDSGNKKGFPGILVIFIIGLIVILAFQNLSDTRSGNVSFSHQLEHLVNLQLIDPEENKKTALNDNLVTFSGNFKERLSEDARNRYRFLTLLDQNHELATEKEDLSKQLSEIQSGVYSSAAYFLAIAGIKIPSGGYVVIPRSFDSRSETRAVIVKTPSSYNQSVGSLVTMEDVKALYRKAETNPSKENLTDLRSSLQSLISQFQSPALGIGSVALKNDLQQAGAFLGKGLELQNMSLALQKVSSVVKTLDSNFNGTGIHLYDLRDVRTYVEKLDLEATKIADYQKNVVQLEKAKSKVSDVVWFYKNQEISTKALEQKSPEEYHQWYLLAKNEWEAFPENQGLGFKAPDQPRNAVLERKFKSEEPAPNYFSYIFTFLPIVLVFLLLYFIFSRQAKGMGSSAMNFGKSTARQLHKNLVKVTFDDVAGIDESKEELEEVVEFLKEPQRFVDIGARIPKGVLLTGPPGTGKTLIAKAIAGEAGVPFYSISGSDFVEMFVGVGASRVRDLFDQAKKSAPCIIFIDEIDAVGRQRGSGLGGGHDEREQTLNQLLVEIDGMDSTDNLIIIAATNRPDVLDPALLRPGRFDRHVPVEAPDYIGRLAILKVHAQKVKMADDVDLKKIAQRASGQVGADLENMINEAALHASKKRRKAVTQDDLYYAHQKIAFGKERKSLKMEEEDEIITSWHEGGHALLSLLLDTKDKATSVSRIPRGRSLGQTFFEIKKNRVNYQKHELLDQCVVLMGGRLGEEMVHEGNGTSGAQMDIKQATRIARLMVTEWGMSEKIGMIDLGEDSSGDLMAGFHEKNYSETTAREVDLEVKKILDEAYNKGKQLLKENYDKLKLIADMLMEFETLDREDLEKIMNDKWSSDDKRKKIERFEASTSRKPPPLPKDIQKKTKKQQRFNEGPSPQPS